MTTCKKRPLRSTALQRAACLGLVLGMGGCSGARPEVAPGAAAPQPRSELAATATPPDGLAPMVEIPNAARSLIPIAGAADLTETNAHALSAALASEEAKPAIVHCGTGNRAGALLALEAFYVHGKPAGEALELGRRAGLTSLEGAVRAQLEAAARTEP